MESALADTGVGARVITPDQTAEESAACDAGAEPTKQAAFGN